MKQHIHTKWTTQTDPYILNLDKAFKPVESGIELEYKQFDFLGGEPHFQITTEVQYGENLIITQRYNSVSDLMMIVLANDAAKRMGFKNIQLILPYFPAARQDRVCNDGEPLTIKVFADMINNCGFDKVFILCPHSEVTPALLNNVVVLDELEYAESIINELLVPYRAYEKIAMKGVKIAEYNIVCPDAGAGKRVSTIVKHLSNKFDNVVFNLIRCEKVRDVKTGELKEFHVQADYLDGKDTIIFDDIVCGGNTFKGLGDVLKSKDCGKLILSVIHADWVNGLQRMIEYFDHVYLTNSKQDWDKYKYTLDNKLTCFKIKL